MSQEGTPIKVGVLVYSHPSLFGLAQLKPQPILDSYPRDFNWEGFHLQNLASLYNDSASMVGEVAKWRLIDDGAGGSDFKF
jgi:hypothetical protein